MGCAQSHASDRLVGSVTHPAVSAALKIIAIRVLQVMVDIPCGFQSGDAGVGAADGLLGPSVATPAAYGYPDANRDARGERVATRACVRPTLTIVAARTAPITAFGLTGDRRSGRLWRAMRRKRQQGRQWHRSRAEARGANRPDQCHLMAKCLHLVRPLMPAATSFKNDQTVLLLSHERRKLCARLPPRLVGELR